MKEKQLENSPVKESSPESRHLTRNGLIACAIAVAMLFLIAFSGVAMNIVGFLNREIIADILAGMSLVFEGEFQVGNTIEVNGYRGVVEEIGVRSTKLIGEDGNVKTIHNSDIGGVINMPKTTLYAGSNSL